MFIIKQCKEGATVSEVCRRSGISQTTHFNWKKKYGSMLPTDMKRLRELVDQIRTDWWVSIRRACAVIRFDPCTYRYRFRLPDQTAIEHRIKEICQTRVRFGYRRVHVLLRREGWENNAKKTYHIYKLLGIQLRNKTPKRRVKAKLREDCEDTVHPSDVWAMDFVHDQLATGHKIRILTVVDTFSRNVAALDAKFSYKREDVVAGSFLPSGWLSQDDQGRQWRRVRLARHGFVGVSAERNARLMTPRKTR